MKYGKLQDISKVNFKLPSEPKSNALVLADSLHSTSQKTIYLGATGYNMRQWKGSWYTPKAKQADFLKQYGKQFNGIEFNTTHYRIPDAKTVQRWYDETPSDFKFSPKIPQTISHRNDMGIQSGDLLRFCETILGLKEKLGVSFMQLPPYFSVEKLPQLERFLEKFPSEIPLAIEVRHPSFFEKTNQAEHYFQVLKNHRIGSVITDVAGERQVCHCRLTTNFVVIRLVGNAFHPTDTERVENWADRLALWFKQGLQSAYVFCHQPDNLLAPEYCALAGKVFSKKIKGVSLRFPEPVPSEGVQGSLF